MRSAWRIGPAGRVALGLVALVVSLLLIIDLLLGVISDRSETQRQIRRSVSESLAVQVAALAQTGDDKALSTTLQEVTARNRDIRSIALRRASGAIVAQSADHARHWQPAAAASNADQLRIPVRAGDGPWGEIEIAFAASSPRSWLDWVKQPMVLLLLVLPVVVFLAFYAYLRRALQYLDPSAAVPDRVRKAFDALTDAVLVLDRQGRVMLANRALRALHPQADAALHGRIVNDLTWLWPADDSTHAPWWRTLHDGSTVSGQAHTIAQPAGGVLHAVIGSAPLLDGLGIARGCLVTIDDVTEVHRTNSELRQALADLERSRQQIKEQNAELHVLATRDSLTGCLNRRAMMERAKTLMASPQGEGLCCIMADIDHFKRFNDQFGHAVGDQVIRAVAQRLERGLRASDALGRHGGEEFCILLPNTSVVDANLLAQRLRVEIMTHAASATRTPGLPPVTASFGVASTAQGIQGLERLLEHADAALYKSKQAGRNRVTLWQADAQAAVTVPT